MKNSLFVSNIFASGFINRKQIEFNDTKSFVIILVESIKIIKENILYNLYYCLITARG
jgi:hypothetical protein